MRRVLAGGRSVARRLALLALRVLVQIAAVAGARPFAVEIEVPSGALLATQIIQFDPQKLVRLFDVAALAERDRSADVLVEQNPFVHQQLVRVDLRPARTVLVLYHFCRRLGGVRCDRSVLQRRFLGEIGSGITGRNRSSGLRAVHRCFRKVRLQSV